MSTRIQAVQSNTDPVLIIGNFDGVHTGHRAVIEAAGEYGPVVAVTFTPHPLQVLRPDKAPRLLTSPERRRELLHACGVADVVEIPFTHEVSQWSPAEFVERALLPLRPCRVVVGANFRFGHRAAGDVAKLAEFGHERGFRVEPLGLAGEAEDERPWSSTVVRERLSQGDVSGAAEVLGRPFAVRGIVQEGDRRGREIGYPTANLPAPPGMALPADGVYAGWLRRLDEAGPDPTETRLPAAISVGTNPTFDGVNRRVEAYVLDRTDLDLYDVAVEVSFVHRIRGMERFDTVAELVRRMAADVEQTREVLAAAHDWEPQAPRW